MLLHSPHPARQHGVALIVVLILLIVVILLGLGAVRGTIIQQKITGNFYDRDVGFQAAEAGLEAAAQTLGTTAANIRLCGSGGGTCPANPFSDSTASAYVQTLATTNFAAGSNGTGQPQYVIENMGAWPDPDSNVGFNRTSNFFNYGQPGTTTTATYYRITSRSGDPSVVGDRAVVTLQAMYKQQ